MNKPPPSLTARLNAVGDKLNAEHAYIRNALKCSCDRIGITVAHMADRAGVNRQTVYSYLDGRHRIQGGDLTALELALLMIEQERKEEGAK